MFKEYCTVPYEELKQAREYLSNYGQFKKAYSFWSWNQKE
jgi:hypothetical protein